MPDSWQGIFDCHTGSKILNFVPLCIVENVERDESRIFEDVKILHMLLIY